jgi:uncharacterized protein YkwD
MYKIPTLTPAPQLLGRLGAVALAALFFSGCGSSSSSTGTPESDPLLQGITAQHNAARAAVMPAAANPIPPLQWSPTLAATAQAWASRCQFGHSSGPYGENIYADTGQGSATDVVASWVGEKSNYTYATNSCAGVCGHYTQVVWAASTSLGCGMQHCTSGSPFGGGAWNFWVCNYDPPGNFNGQKPY